MARRAAVIEGKVPDFDFVAPSPVRQGCELRHEEEPRMVELPKPIEAYIAGSNAHDADACAACFADDAIVRDEGREMRGVAAVRDWMDAAIAKYRHTVEVVSSAKTDGGTMVTCRVSGNFPGSPVELRHAFVVAGEKITHLEIVP